MGNALLDRLNEDRQKQVDYIGQLMDRAAADERDLVEAERNSIDAANVAIQKLDEQIAPVVAFENIRDSSVGMVQRASGRTPARTSPRPAAPMSGEQFRSFGDLYVQDEGFVARNLLSHRVEVADVDVVQLAMQTRALLTEGATPGSLLLPSKDRFVSSTPAFATPLLDMISTIPVTSNSVDVITYGEFVGSDVVAEGSAKPEAVPTVGTTPTPLETIAGWVKYTRQLAEDAPGFAAWLNSGITRDILRKLQSQVAGVINAAAIPTTTGAAGKPLIEVVRQAMADVESRGFSPNALLAAPSVLAGLDISVLNLGGAAGTVLGNGAWGLTPIPVPGFTSVIVADAAEAFVLFTKRGVSIYTTDSDVSGAGSTAASDFRSNILTTLGETRAKGAVQNPNAASKAVVTP